MLRWLTLGSAAVATTIIILAVPTPETTLGDVQPDEKVETYKKAPIAVPVPDFVYWQQRIIAASLQYGNDPYLALCIAVKENDTLNPKRRNEAGSSAGGIFQIIDSMWVQSVARMGLDWSLEDKYDGEKNIIVGSWLLANGGPTQWEVYNQGKCS